MNLRTYDNTSKLASSLVHMHHGLRFNSAWANTVFLRVGPGVFEMGLKFSLSLH